MAIPTSKPLSLSTVQTEYGGSNPINMSEYRGDGNAPASGPIDLWADFNGTSNTAQIEIRTYGAQGGSNGGQGGRTSVFLTCESGVAFMLYAGGQGESGSGYLGSAGGACSFVTVNSASGTLIAVAGGGGGSSQQSDGGGGNSGGLPVAYGGSGGSGGSANNTNARYSADPGRDWTHGSEPGKGGNGSAAGIQFDTAYPGENPGGKGYGGTGRTAEDYNDHGGHAGGGGYGGGGGGCTEDGSGSALSGGGGGGYGITSGYPTGVVGAYSPITGAVGANSGHGYIQVYRDGVLVKTVTATSRTGAFGSYTV